MHDRVRVRYETGFYDGQMMSGMWHGYGVYKWNNGDVYIGEWHQSRFHGYGVYHWASKDNRRGVGVGVEHGMSSQSGNVGNAVSQSGNVGNRDNASDVDVTNIYAGQWVDDLPDGFGVRRYDRTNTTHN